MATTTRIFDPALYPKFRTKSGLLTAYSFACGYVEEYSPNNITIQKDGVWHVRAETPNGAHCWECFDGLKDARKFARSVAKSGIPANMIRGYVPQTLRKQS